MNPKVDAGFSLKPAPMQGAGAYNRDSRVQAAGASPALPHWARAAAEVVLPPDPDPVVIADYGASQGHNSFVPMAAAIHAIRRRTNPDRAISIVHTDLPNSDFSALFQALTSDPESYLAGDSSCFASAVGRSFYEQILPCASITLGWCSWAVQWLSRAPAPIPDQLQVSFSSDGTVRELYERQAADDWRAFLTHRAAEMRPGGRLVILTMALTADGDFGYRPILVAMYAALRLLVDEGFMTETELKAMAIPTVGRSLDQLRRPFAQGRFARLSIDVAEVFSGPDPIWEDFKRDQDSRTYAQRWAAFSRASVLPTLATALEGSAERKTEFISRVESSMVTQLMQAPEKFPIPLGLVVLRKEG